MDSVRLATAALSDAWYRARGLPPDPATFGRGWRGVAIAAPVAALLGPALGMQLGDLLLGRESPSLLDWGKGSTRVTLTLGVLGTAVSVFVFTMIERLAMARAQAEAAQRAAAEHQLKLLQSQLEPHMLFNTLANLRVLIGLDAIRAQEMLDRLIAFLRSSLSASRSPSHALATEFRHLDDYLALMAIRMGPRLAVAFDLPPELGASPVPPLLLQPLVENAIKHGLEPKVEGGRIAVSARRDGDMLQLQVRDTGVGPGAAATTAGTGFGLEQVRTRLATLFGGRATLALAAAGDTDGGTLVTLRLPLPSP
ncbi:MAG: histidine kinase [Rubrivivax sp.]|nr:histidine kinase [Rubrivivax sp.]